MAYVRMYDPRGYLEKEWGGGGGGSSDPGVSEGLEGWGSRGGVGRDGDGKGWGLQNSRVLSSQP